MRRGAARPGSPPRALGSGTAADRRCRRAWASARPRFRGQSSSPLGVRPATPRSPSAEPSLGPHPPAIHPIAPQPTVPPGL
ncbi:hypothetical protein [Paraliomyxa miuraensis]|uniref:hypothetical protein n=1 Tax=Paraliomyxa miuraensis TaxID=376150 RepID=UPI003899B415